MRTAGLRLNIARWTPRSVANGPGARSVVWVQGCLQRCDGCCNREMQARVRRHEIAVDALATKIPTVHGIEGVTYSGGEPMLQARALAILSQHLRGHGLSVMCFTGYTLEDLRSHSRPWIRRFLEQIDVLVDGPYLRSRAASSVWRASDNQRVHFLTDRYSHLAGQLDRQPAQVEFVVGTSAYLSTGTWPEGFMADLEREIRGEITTDQTSGVPAPCRPSRSGVDTREN